MKPICYAHSSTQGPFEPLFSDSTSCPTILGKPCEQCENLNPQHGHLNKVAYWAATFSEEMFPPGDDREVAHAWGFLSGLWHDLGKFAPEWQRYLLAKANMEEGEYSGQMDHSTAGAQHADQKIGILGRLLAYLIAGHHAGLANGMDNSDGSLEKRLKKTVANFSVAPDELLNRIHSSPFRIPAFGRSGHSLAFFMRMIFSCLVDADFLATEAFMNPQQAQSRPTHLPSIQELETTLDLYLSRFGPPTTEINRLRAEILETCRAKASAPPGLFSLTVPTGGGKTLSSLAFALHHARIHHLRRVIYVIPYTSIIEQNAESFRKALAALGDDIVLEHHSSLDPEESARPLSKLAAENWDARIIVTTNVRFFEALHANRTSACRRLHRIARSVIILDEAQSLPIEYMKTCLRALEELTDHYGATVVLCTATQPAIEHRPGFEIGLRKPTEIIPDPRALYLSMRRVKTVQLGKQENEEIARLLLEHSQVLCIVNTRRQARILAELLPRGGDTIHLSALMCPAHRAHVLREIKHRLTQGLPTRVVSTQLVEAGVDIDFPVVFREIAGLDSIAQAAGRCDREGLLTLKEGRPAGQLFIFKSPVLPPPGYIRASANSAEQIFAQSPVDPLDLDAIGTYFKHHYWTQSHAMDTKNILACWPDLNQEDPTRQFMFKDCAERLKWIEDYTDPVLVPYGETGRGLCQQLREEHNPVEQRNLARRLQRYIVNIPPCQRARLIASGAIQLYCDTYAILTSSVHYSDHFGLHPEPNIDLPPTQSIL